jgi:hypothetical protein
MKKARLYSVTLPEAFRVRGGNPKTQRRLELAQLDHPIGEQGNENDNNNGNADDD